MKLALLFVFIASPLFAQTHECDITVLPSAPMVLAGQVFTLGWCHDGKDSSGGALPGDVNWKIYRGTTQLTGLKFTKGSNPNVDGLYYYTMKRAESNVGTFDFKVVASITVSGMAIGEKPVVLDSTPAVLKVRVLGPPTVPVKVRSSL